MNLLLDTNIIIQISRPHQITSFLKVINPNDDELYISLASYAEVMSFATRNNWGERRLEKLNDFISNVRIVEITDYLINFYVEIDTFSQRKNPNFTTYDFPSAITMGKNDLWIAATAAFLDLTLVTTHKDFNHLHDVFLDVYYLESDTLRGYFS
jgi:tRNA(fMet)-specific endonuclease VapC